MNIGLLVVIAIVGGVFMIFGVMNSVEGEATSYSNFKEAKSTGEMVHVAGTWINREEANYDHNRDLFTFWMQDTLQNIAQVHYNDPMPTNFESAEKVVCVGSFQSEVFVAEKILMKCPSKYEPELGDELAQGQVWEAKK